MPPCRRRLVHVHSRVEVKVRGCPEGVANRLCHLFSIKAAKFPTICLVHSMDGSTDVSIQADGEGSGWLQLNAKSSGNGDKQKTLQLKEKCQHLNIEPERSGKPPESPCPVCKMGYIGLTAAPRFPNKKPMKPWAMAPISPRLRYPRSPRSMARKR